MLELANYLKRLILQILIITDLRFNHNRTHDFGGASTLRSEGPVNGHYAGQVMSRGETTGQSYNLSFNCIYLLWSFHLHTGHRAWPQSWAERKIIRSIFIILFRIITKTLQNYRFMLWNSLIKHLCGWSSWFLHHPLLPNCSHNAGPIPFASCYTLLTLMNTITHVFHNIQGFISCHMDTSGNTGENSQPASSDYSHMISGAKIMSYLIFFEVYFLMSAQIM